MTKNEKTGFPLSVVFLLIAVIAVMVATLGSSLQRNTIGPTPKRTGFFRTRIGPIPDVDSTHLAIAIVAGVFTGAGVGGYLGWQSPRPVAGVLLGVPVGIIQGGLIATILVCPPDFTIMLSGCAIILVAAATTRLLTG